jgi:hypothetical protein
MSGIAAVAFPMQLVDLGADPSHRLPTPVCNPCLPFSVLEKGVESRKMQASFQPQRGNPHGIISVNTPGNINKNPHFPVASDGTDNDFREVWDANLFFHVKLDK